MVKVPLTVQELNFMKCDAMMKTCTTGNMGQAIRDMILWLLMA